MAQATYTPISLYYSTTAAAVPTAGNLVAGELALNTVDEKLYFKNSAGTVKLLASNAVTTPVTTITFGTTGLTPSTATSGAVTVAGTLANTNGGTGATAAFTQYGVPYASSTTVLATTAAGTATTVLHGNASGAPTFGAVSLTADVSGTLPNTNGGTGQSSAFTQYGVTYASTTSVLATTANGTTGQVFTATTGGAPGWAAAPTGGIAYTAVQTSNYTAANNDGVLTNTTGGAFTVTLPTSPSVGNQIIVADSFGTWGTNNLTIDPTALIKIAGQTAGTTLTCNINSVAVTLVYTGAAYGWDIFAQIGANDTSVLTQTNTVSGITNKTFVAPVLGTPASGVVTNLTGTASININGTVGATTPTTVVATTVKASTTMGVGAATPSASGAGITFPASQSASTDANTLDDYEEGTWTPSVGGTATYTSQVAIYTKIGRLVSVTFVMNILLRGTGSTTTITGLPFAQISAANRSAGAVAYYQGIAVNVLSVIPVIDGATSSIFFSGSTTASATITDSLAIVGNNANIYSSITYTA